MQSCGVGEAMKESDVLTSDFGKVEEPVFLACSDFLLALSMWFVSTGISGLLRNSRNPCSLLTGVV
jgi:hypothetical protein